MHFGAASVGTALLVPTGRSDAAFFDQIEKHAVNKALTGPLPASLRDSRPATPASLGSISRGGALLWKDGVHATEPSREAIHSKGKTVAFFFPQKCRKSNSRCRHVQRREGAGGFRSRPARWAILKTRRAENYRSGDRLYSAASIDDTPHHCVAERAQSAATKAEHGLDLTLLDHPQLMQGRGAESGDNRQQEIGNLSFLRRWLASSSFGSSPYPSSAQRRSSRQRSAYAL